MGNVMFDRVKLEWFNQQYLQKLPIGELVPAVRWELERSGLWRAEWGLGAPHVVGPDVGAAAALFLAAKSPERVTSMTIGGGAVRFPIEAGGALRDVIEAPSLDDVAHRHGPA